MWVLRFTKGIVRERKQWRALSHPMRGNLCAGYSRNVDKDVPNLISMLKGRGCSNVHMHLERIPFDEAAKDVEVCAALLWRLCTSHSFGSLCVFLRDWLWH
jgi:hypothetical protein